MWKNYALCLLVCFSLSCAFALPRLQKKEIRLESTGRCKWLGINSKGVILEAYVGPISMHWLAYQLDIGRSVIYDCPPREPIGVINKSFNPPKSKKKP